MKIQFLGAAKEVTGNKQLIATKSERFTNIEIPSLGDEAIL